MITYFIIKIKYFYVKFSGKRCFLNLNHRITTIKILNNSEVSFIKGLEYYNPSPTIIENNFSVFHYVGVCRFPGAVSKRLLL